MKDGLKLLRQKGFSLIIMKAGPYTKVQNFYYLNLIKATPSAYEADIRADATLQVYFSDILCTRSLPHQYHH